MTFGESLGKSALMDTWVMVNVNFLKKRFHVKCALCGNMCTATFMEYEARVTMPKCPVPPGHWRLHMPMKALLEQGSENFHPTGTVAWHTKIINDLNQTTLEFE